MKHAKAASAGNGLVQHESSDQAISARTSHNSAGEGAGSRRGKAKTDAIALLKADHRKVEKLFAACMGEDDPAKKAELAKQICAELIIHTRLEEEIFYRACRDAGVEGSSLDEAQVEHDGAKVLIADLLTGSPRDEFYPAKIKVLSEYIKHHIKEEEKPRTGVFARATKAKLDTAALGERMQDHKDRLTAQKETLSTSPLEARSLHLQGIHTTQENTQMGRNYQGNYGRNRVTREEDYGTGGRGYSLRGRNEYSARQDHDQDRDRQGSNRSQQSYSGDYDRSSGAYGNSDRGRDADHHRYSYQSNEDYPDRGSRDMQGRNRDWDQDRNRSWESQSQSGPRYNYDEDEDYSGSFRTGQGHQGHSQYDRGQHGGQYSQTNYGQNRNQSGYSQGNYGRDDQSRYSQGSSYGQYGEDEDYGSRPGRAQQSQGSMQGRGQQTSQNRYRDDESHDQGYGQGYGSSGSSSQRDWEDNDRFTRSTRRNPQHRD